MTGCVLLKIRILLGRDVPLQPLSILLESRLKQTVFNSKQRGSQLILLLILLLLGFLHVFSLTASTCLFSSFIALTLCCCDRILSCYSSAFFLAYFKNLSNLLLLTFQLDLGFFEMLVQRPEYTFVALLDRLGDFAE